MKIALVAGEASGDLLGAGLINAIRARVPGATFEGVAGPAMLAAGCERLEDAEALAVMGLIEPLKHVPRLLRLRRSLAKRWIQSPPDVFVGIDAPDFNFGLEKKLRRAGVRTAHYVSPTIWAWREGRVNTVRQAADLVLCILPFEKEVYDSHGIASVFVGHPKADSIPLDIDSVAAREVLGLGDAPVIAMLPGSRMSEVSRLGPVFAAAAALIRDTQPGAQFVVPAATSKLRGVIEAQLADADVTDAFRLCDGGSIEVMAAADVVVLASGTAALEAALLCRPTIAAYKVSRLTAMILRLFKLLKTDYFTLPNLLTETPVIPELIQEAATPEAVAAEVNSLLGDAARCEAIANRFAKLRTELALGADDRAAEAVINLAT